MTFEVGEFSIDKEIDLTKASLQDIANKTLEALKDVEKGHYMLVYIGDYSHIAYIARAVVTKKATVESVLKKGDNQWTVMVKNDVPVAQTG